jgi:hypothetical protein
VGLWERWAEREQRRTDLENRNDVSLSLFGAGGIAHVTSILMLIGPFEAVMLAGRDAFERRHALAAVILNLGTLVVSLLIGALVGCDGWALALQALVVAALIGGAAAQHSASQAS